jgi:hypothetical protein
MLVSPKDQLYCEMLLDTFNGMKSTSLFAHWFCVLKVISGAWVADTVIFPDFAVTFPSVSFAYRQTEKLPEVVLEIAGSKAVENSVSEKQLFGKSI